MLPKRCHRHRLRGPSRWTRASSVPDRSRPAEHAHSSETSSIRMSHSPSSGLQMSSDRIPKIRMLWVNMLSYRAMVVDLMSVVAMMASRRWVAEHTV